MIMSKLITMLFSSEIIIRLDSSSRFDSSSAKKLISQIVLTKTYQFVTIIPRIIIEIFSLIDLEINNISRSGGNNISAWDIINDSAVYGSDRFQRL